MQELLGRISRLDASASLGLRVIACFDELVVGNVNTRGLLAAAASLAGCPAGSRVDVRASGTERSARVVRVDPRGNLLDGDPPPHLSSAHPAAGLEVWLEREGDPLPNDSMILERLGLAVRLRHGLDRRDLDHRRHLGVLTDRQADVEDRVAAGEALGLTTHARYRVAAAPLFAVWTQHPAGPEDVLPTRHGPIHAVVLPESHEPFEASPCGLGPAAPLERLHDSFRVAMVALRLARPPEEPLVDADTYGGLVALLADSGEDSHQPDLEGMARVAEQPWGLPTVDALVRTQSVREAARLAGVHHSTLGARLTTISDLLGYDPLGGFGRARLGMAYLGHRLRHSTVLDLPAPR
ncbi:helix-turn-helix domain-containing protein [Nocardioides bruguierae]|uniref:helix-turn-helix domain-containing protein n=1 Tax=Nocardioides bruguierae TaxID=2945102 RepID=UPI0020204440|nr:helix-turn-helix domain-containing protein [Nocardioides bruguierae]MCL8024314.1 helix-turn-helix domain-containing protein [Nocardioides bruguierae]